MGGALDDLAATAQDLLSRLTPAPAAYNASKVQPGNVVRCGAKAQNQSRVEGWNTNKPSVPGLFISSTGCGSDYNHYRTTKYRSDNERAVSILTTDVLGALNGEGWPVRVGDLGENLYVDRMRYDTFAIGRRFKFGTTTILEITEPIAPCAYLCTLPYLTPKWRCADFIRTLDRRRGWYAKVIATGPVSVGDAVVAL
jgi:MOSC domain-containing protein YiiM